MSSKSDGLDSLFARIAAHPTTEAKYLSEGETCIKDWELVKGWTRDEAKKQLALMLKRGEIEQVGPRKSYRQGEPVMGGRVYAYRFTEKDNGGAKPDETKRSPKAHSKPARRGGVDSRKSRRPAKSAR